MRVETIICIAALKGWVTSASPDEVVIDGRLHIELRDGEAVHIESEEHLLRLLAQVSPSSVPSFSGEHKSTRMSPALQGGSYDKD